MGLRQALVQDAAGLRRALFQIDGAFHQVLVQVAVGLCRVLSQVAAAFSAAQAVFGPAFRQARVAGLLPTGGGVLGSIGFNLELRMMGCDPCFLSIFSMV